MNTDQGIPNLGIRSGLVIILVLDDNVVEVQSHKYAENRERFN